MDYETVCGITLNRIFGYEPAAALSLIKHFGSPGAVFSQDSKTLDNALGPYSKYRGLLTHDELEASRKEWDWLKELGCTFVNYCEPGYPPLLADCPDAPVGLYIRSGTPPEELFTGAGNSTIGSGTTGSKANGSTTFTRDSISIVGTRDLSPYGKEWTEKIVGSISRSPAKPMIVSGFAIGVDITAHLAALAFGLPTVAVIPVGIDSIYPLRHRTVAAKMMDTPGCALVTDFPPETGPVPFNFLRRNRIIAGMSRATILTESKSKGGGTMTARLAASYGRELFCLPGRIDDVRSSGCNILIKEQLAEAITDPDGIAAQLGLGSTGKGARDLKEMLHACYGSAGEEVCGRLTAIALHIKANRGATPDEICRALGLPYGDVAAACSLLESDGFICMDLLQRCSIDNKKAYLCT
ncbi:MAG: DNA-protecting protein DprA [Bacteroidales bacterium]|nr:DNA-protecting protein DprA [Bacteroidales bacterium]